MLERIRRIVAGYIDSVASIAVRLKLTPGSICLLGLLSALVSGLILYMYGSRLLLYASILILLSGFMDALDGAVARLTNRTSRFGAFLDSTVDRVEESIILGSVILGGLCDISVGLVALVGSLLTSYMRARAESIGVNLAGVGLGERAERILILGLLTMAGYPDIAIAVIAVITAITSIHRFLYVYVKSRSL
ncbi:MAG: CDP-alcohol phosphatidyltransferase family protein [Candidatus Bathyarchaeia archaeon]